MRPRIGYPFPLAPLYPAVFLSGATALVYEIVWTRRLSLLLGSTTGAVAAVLSSFMLGMALGAVAVGHRSDQSRRPLRWYGVLELGIGFYALAFDSIHSLAARALPQAPWLVAFAVLVLPAALMGGTLPVLARAAADTTRRGTHALGSLYGVNTLGAVAGALATTLFLLERDGLSGTTHIAAAVNIGLGALFWLLSVPAGSRPVFSAEEEPPSGHVLGGAGLAVAGAFFVAGFSGLALEVAWTRVLVYLLEGFTIAFGLMLAAYLLGLGGGAILGTWLALRSSHPRRLLVWLLVLEALLVMGTFCFVGSLVEPLDAMRAAQAQADSIGAAYGFGLFAAAAAVIVPPTLCAGALLPVVARVVLRDRERIGLHSGLVYAASTCGAVLAPPIAGFLLIPLLGVPGTIAAAGGLLLVAALLAAVKTGRFPLVAVGGGAALFAVLSLLAGLGVPMVVRSHVLRHAKHPRRLLRFEEGRQAGVAVVEDLGTGVRALYVDDFRAAETGPQYGYMRMLAHLPILLHPDPKRVLVIAFGTGTTAGAAAVHPEVKQVTCVEIEKKVYDVASEFKKQNRDVLDSPKVKAVVADGREYIERKGDPFDVVTLEPLMPYTPGAVYLYTKEFYEAVRKRLAPGGFLCQWIPIHALRNDDFRRLISSMTAVYPFVSLWYFEQSCAVLCGEAPPKIDYQSLLQRCAQPQVAQDLRIALVGDASHLLGSHVCSGAALLKSLGGIPPMTDDRTVVEFRPLPRDFGRRSWRYKLENFQYLSRIHQESIPWIHDAQLQNQIATAIASDGEVLKARAAECAAILDPEHVPYPGSTKLAAAVARDPAALYLRAVYQQREYGELLGQAGLAEKEGRDPDAAMLYARAAQLEEVSDRSAAFVGLAKHASGKSRIRFLTLAVRQDARIAPHLLKELAEHLDGAERRFCLNRARMQEGEPLESGKEALPRVALPDVAALLAKGDAAAVKEALEESALAGAREEAEHVVWGFFENAKDQAAALRLLEASGSRQTLRAALKLYSRGTREDLIAAAPVLCERYPGLKYWQNLTRHPSAKVRSAAAEAAQRYGNAAHLPILATLCADPDQEVRLSAYLSFRRIDPSADSIGYDYHHPTKEQLAALEKHARAAH